MADAGRSKKVKADARADGGRRDVDAFVNMGLLYDYYGELLTEKRRGVYEDAVYNDLSLSEIAEREGTSRQGVHDLIRRSTKTLESYEEKLGMIARDAKIRETCGRIARIAEENGGANGKKIVSLIGEIVEILGV